MSTPEAVRDKYIGALEQESEMLKRLLKMDNVEYEDLSTYLAFSNNTASAGAQYRAL